MLWLHLARYTSESRGTWEGNEKNIGGGRLKPGSCPSSTVKELRESRQVLSPLCAAFSI